MEGSVRLQEWIHRLEVGAGARYLRILLAVVAFGMLAVVYNTLCFRNLHRREAMDAGQLARNISEGKGYVTSYVRPLSLALQSGPDARTAGSLLDGNHPDISNPPVYPTLLAGVLGITPAPRDMTQTRRFQIAPMDMTVALLNQCLMGLAMFLVFRLALRWFDQVVAWTSAVLFALTELYWRVSISGLSTMLLIVLTLLLISFLSRFEQLAREGAGGGKLATLAAAMGFLSGALALTRYSMGWLVVPVAVFVGYFALRRRLVMILLTVAGFAVPVAPWLARNVVTSGWAFGTATFEVFRNTALFPGDTLERSLVPVLSGGLPGYGERMFWSVLDKGIVNVREVVSTDLPGMAGSWLWAFFLVGLLLPFRNVNLSRLRWFVVAALGVLIPVQAFTRSVPGPEETGVGVGGLLVVLSPFVIIFAVGVFFVLVESLEVPSRAARYVVVAGFMTLMTLPLLLSFLPPRSSAVVRPYYPPRIQQIAEYMEKGEVLVSDIPWAVAWYGRRQSVGLPMSQKEFELLNGRKAVNGLYVSTRTTDEKFFSSWFAGENQGWGSFLLQSFVQHEIPNAFPLKKSPEGLFANGELLLMDRDRWSAQVAAENRKKD